MTKNKFHKWLEKEIETEADALEKKADETAEDEPELSSIRMPENSYEDLMKRIEETNRKKSSSKTFHIRRRALIALGLAAALLAALGLGASGERLFAPKVESQVADGSYNVRVINGDNVQYFEWTVEEAYEEIEERLGILALRLGYMPQGMELEKVTIGEDMGEAQMEMRYENSVLRIYENKQNGDSIFETQFDGEIIGSIDTFYYEKELNIIEMNINDNESFYETQLQQGNAYYYITSNMNIDEFKEIVRGIFFKNV